ncbi:hypothetical protein H9Q69_012662 [Fusarium xylarioides]|nr:hypothetical protein H9Q70_006776 [Fusarium xylarioides]KAG5779352.1 hypothetical protein H9Q73_007012 [Fusarium xylarioides]KAG5788268.1 hypothetical protein H9Q69_012662 [Fusarium xylarioides]
MASQQEAERVIRELTGEYKLEENVYESGRRFLRERLLYINARYFTKAIKRSEDPYISFKIHSSHIEVDFNDDGFTKADLEHLCMPSATVQKGTIRYDLDCVFKSTAKIYIHSGNFSLDMRLTTSEGKIRPTWVSPLTSMLDTRTYMAIYFHDNGTEEDLKLLKGIILAQFEILEAESLLFLPGLLCITVEFYGKGGELRRWKKFQKLLDEVHHASLKSKSDDHGFVCEESQAYHVTNQATGGRRNITLAFPLTEEGMPLISTRKTDIFNVLPCSSSNYNFLIDGDFEANYQQEDIEPCSPRDKSIHIWIATAFMQAIFKFRDHPSLCYEWPVFLPRISYNTPLSLEIRHMLRWHLLLKVYKQTRLCCLNDVTILPNHLKDEKGQPLLDPAAKHKLLSTNYPPSVLAIFTDYGAQTMQNDTFMELLAADMRSQNPKMHQENTTEEWHARVARFLLRVSETSALRVKSLSIVPLTNGTWTSMLFDSVYFPSTGGISVPETVDLSTVAPSAIQDTDRYALLKYLGVTEPSLETTRKSIRESLISAPDTIPLKRVNDYLQYLYLTHEASDWMRYDYEEVLVLSTDSELECPQHDSKVVYLPGKDYPFSPESLLGPMKSEPSLSYSFLHPETLNYVPTQDNTSHISWRRWLCDYVGVREEICFESPSTGKLSHDFLHIVNQNPDMLLDLLEHLISKGEVDLSSESAIISEIRQLPASNLCGVESTIKLQDTWLPLKTLIDIVGSYMEQPDQFPFLRSIQDPTGGIDTKWNFLSEHLLVGKEDNLDFLLEILCSIRRSDPKNDPNRQLQKVLDLYASIQAKFTASGKMTTDREKLRNLFNESGIVYFNGEELEWTTSSSCLWDSPPGMVTMRSLKSCYDLQSSNAEAGSDLQSLFIETLGIQNAKLEHLVAELKELRITNVEDPAKILQVYDFMNTNICSSQDIRVLFESSPLIFIPDGPHIGWHTSTEVLWSSNTDLCGMGTLDDTYESLRGFFVDQLGIEPLSLRILYDRLIKSPKCKPQQMKEAIFILNDFLRSEPAFLDPQPVRNA